MNTPMLRATARLTCLAFTANLVLVPMVRADEARTRARDLQGMMLSSGAMAQSWTDQRKSMETLKQRVKDSRLFLDLNGRDAYMKRAKVMLDVERQRARRAASHLLREGHTARVVEELKKSGHKELVELANNMGLATMTAESPGSALDNYLSYRMQGYDQALAEMKTEDIREVMVATEDSAERYIKTGGDVRQLNAGIFAEGDEPQKGGLMKWIVGAIAGVGLVIAVFFSLTTMTLTPFLSFLATVIGLLALLGKNSAFQSILYGNPYGPWAGPNNPYQPWNPYYPYPPYPQQPMQPPPAR